MERPGRTVAIIQARMGSARFPGKMLAEFRGRPLIRSVVDSIWRSETIDELVVAIPDGEPDDVLADCLTEHRYSYFRGPEDDVLKRVAWAAASRVANTIVRVCGDSPFMPATRIDELVRSHRDNHAQYSAYRFPDGVPAITEPWGVFPEVVSIDLIEKMDHLCNDLLNREHVTRWMYRGPHRETFNWITVDRPQVSLNIDEPSDMERLEALNLATTNS